MLARLLEKLFDADCYSPQAKAVWTMLLIATFGVVCLYTGQGPTHAEEIAAARTLSYRGVIRSIAPDHGRLQVWVDEKGKVVEASDLEQFYQERAYLQLVDAMPNNIFLFAQARPFALPLQAHVRDSVIKKSGALSVQMVRGDSVYRFRYKCAWHDSL